MQKLNDWWSVLASTLSLSYYIYTSMLAVMVNFVSISSISNYLKPFQMLCAGHTSQVVLYLKLDLRKVQGQFGNQIQQLVCT